MRVGLRQLSGMLVMVFALSSLSVCLLLPSALAGAAAQLLPTNSHVNFSWNTVALPPSTLPGPPSPRNTKAMLLAILTPSGKAMTSAALGLLT